MRIILASSSPRRKEILSLILKEFEVIPSEIEEKVVSKNPLTTAKYLARVKARDVWSKNKDSIVIGSDTLVFFKGKILGKPKDKGEAFKMLLELSGNWHTVYTAVCFYSSIKKITICDRSLVKFRKLDEDEIRAYIETGEPLDKAGAYGVQGFGSTIVEKIRGNFFTVMGLPVVKVYTVLKREFNLPPSLFRIFS